MRSYRKPSYKRVTERLNAERKRSIANVKAIYNPRKDFQIRELFEYQDLKYALAIDGSFAHKVFLNHFFMGSFLTL